MNRRQILRLLASAGVLLATPGRLLAASADSLAAKAQEALGAGDAQQALALLLEARNKDPRNDRVEALLGRTYFQLGRAGEALPHFQMAVRLNPEDTLSRVMAGTISQFPLEKRAPGATVRPPARPSASLEDAAKAERRALLGGRAAMRAKGPWRVLVDAGHGGMDVGAAGGEGPRESDVTLDLALRLGRVLAASRDTVAVFLTRTADVSLPGWGRASLAGYYDADALVSLHATRLPDPQASGMRIYSYAKVEGDILARTVAGVENTAYRPRPAMVGWDGQALFTGVTREVAGRETVLRGARLAESLAKAVPAGLPVSGRGTGAAPFRLLAEATVPAVLVEVGLLSNAGDLAVLSDAAKRQGLAQGLAGMLLAALPVLAGDAPS